RRAGISKGVISYHFAGKRDLIEQVVAQVEADEAHFNDIVRHHGETAAGKLRFYIQSHFDFVKRQRKLLRALLEIFEHIQREDDTPFYEGEAFQRRIQLMEDIFREGQAAGEFRAFDPRVMALSIRAVLDSLSVQLNVHPDLNLDASASEVI